MLHTKISFKKLTNFIYAVNHIYVYNVSMEVLYD